MEKSARFDTQGEESGKKDTCGLLSEGRDPAPLHSEQFDTESSSLLEDHSNSDHLLNKNQAKSSHTEDRILLLHEEEISRSINTGARDNHRDKKDEAAFDGFSQETTLDVNNEATSALFGTGKDPINRFIIVENDKEVEAGTDSTKEHETSCEKSRY